MQPEIFISPSEDEETGQAFGLGITRVGRSSR